MEAIKTGKRVLVDDDTLLYGPPVCVLTATIEEIQAVSVELVNIASRI